MLKEFEAGGRTYELYGISGKVINSGKTSTFHTYSSGGDYDSNTGTYNSPTYHTSSSIHDQIFLVDKEGKEHVIKLTNWDVAVRESHEITAYWAIRKGKNRGPYVAILNHTINQNLFYDDKIRLMYKPFFRKWLFLATVVVICYVAKLSFDNFYEREMQNNINLGYFNPVSTPDTFFMGLKIIGFTIAVIIVAIIVYKIIINRITKNGLTQFKKEVMDLKN